MRIPYLLAGLVLACALPLAANADTVNTSIGTQHFVDGSSVTSAAYTSAVAGQPAPFNAFCGSISSGDCTGITWTFNYTVPAGDTITGATLSIGILNLQSSASANPVGSFTLDGTDVLTGLLNTAAVAANSIRNEYNVLQISIPGADFTDLSSGMATFSLTLSGPGLGVLGMTPSHTSGFDFSTLNITATPGTTPPPVPEPATLALLLLGAAAFAAKVALSKLPQPPVQA
ncbi:MAG TPA: PEP-CTERM sorting domain-containing protein [Candidatus Acidoferrum sp.]|nr:PEP-CTERM sorting domain-containing protein [Candidatus Acidoferrum sp.]